jgi:hypothetical protein
MPAIVLRRTVPAVVSTLLVLPFMILELANRRAFHEGFPVPLFGILWLLPLFFMLILVPVVRSLPAGRRSLRARLAYLLGILLMGLIAWLWAGIVADQMPCFLGVPLCD